MRKPNATLQIEPGSEVVQGPESRTSGSLSSAFLPMLETNHSKASVANGTATNTRGKHTNAGFIPITDDMLDPRIQFLKDHAKWTKCSTGRKMHCPAHDDEHPSLSINIAPNGRLILKDFSDSACSPDKIAVYLGLQPYWLSAKCAHRIAEVYGRKYDLVYFVLKKFLKENPNGFRGTAEELHRVLTPLVPEYFLGTKAWPKNGQALSRRINLLVKAKLDFGGYRIERQVSGHCRRIFIIPEDRLSEIRRYRLRPRT